MTIRHAQILFLAAIAMVIPLRAAAQDEPAPSLNVSASLDSCGVASTGIVCQINVGFNSLPDADYYTASVTMADASVRGYGQVGSASTLWVPYVGAGTYYVEVTAWGSNDQGEDTPIDSDTGDIGQLPSDPTDDGGAAGADSGDGTDSTVDPAPSDPGTDPAVEPPLDPAPVDPAPTEPAPTEPPVVVEPAPVEPAPTPTPAQCPEQAADPTAACPAAAAAAPEATPDAAAG